MDQTTSFEAAHDVAVVDAEPVAPRAPAGSPVVRRLGYQPALDGLRGLALVAIVVYHAELSFAPGAFLSVSTFFTLSGFLITALALGEIGTTGTFSLRGFWSRRFRRLFPAAICATGAILLLAFWFADSSQRARIPGDALASLLYVVNWRFVFSGTSYAAIFQSASPFTHFWTLSIEEQFYLFFPLLLAAVVLVARGSRAVLAAVFGLLVVASTAWSAALVHNGASIDRVYFGTDTRLAEFAAGALFAVWWMRPGRRPVGRVRRAAWSGAIALAAMIALWVVSAQSERLWYSGGLAVYSCITLAVVLGALQPRGPVRQLLGSRPLVWVGTVSYAAYLIHWPVLLWLDRVRGLKPEPRFVVGLALTLLLAGLFTRVVERPIRARRLLSRRQWSLAVPVAVATVVALIAVSAVTAPPDRTTIDFAAAQAHVDALTSGGVPASPEAGDFERYVQRQELLDASTAPRVAFFGDSTALMDGLGVDDWSIRDQFATLAPQAGVTLLGCGLLTGVGQIVKGRKGVVSSDCDDYVARWRAAVTDEHVDIAVVQVGSWDVLDQRLTPDGPWLTIGEDPALDDALRAELDGVVDLLREHVGLVVLINSPDVVAGMVDGRAPTVTYPESDPARMARFREILHQVADQDPHVVVADLHGFLQGRPDQWELRPDGVHPTPATADVIGAWLGPEIRRLWDADRSSTSGD